MPTKTLQIEIIPLGNASWSQLPALIASPDEPTVLDFSQYFTRGNAPVTFAVELAQNADGSGMLPEDLRNTAVSILGQILTVDVSQVTGTGTFYYRLTARERTGDDREMARVAADWQIISVQQQLQSQWSAFPPLSIYEGFAGNFDFDTYFTIGSPPPVSYEVELALNISGTPIPSGNELSSITATTQLGAVAIFNAMSVTLSHATNNSTLYFRIVAVQSNSDRIESSWTVLTILNSYAAAWRSLPEKQLHEGDMITFDFGSVFDEGAPLTMMFEVELARNTVGDDIIDVNLDTELVATVNSTEREVTIDATAVTGLSADANVYYRIVAVQPDPS